MFGPQNFIVLEKLNELRQRELTEQARQYRLINEAARLHPTVWQRAAGYIGSKSISLGLWLQARSIPQMEPQNC